MHLWNKESRRLKIEEGSVMVRIISDHRVTCKNLMLASLLRPSFEFLSTNNVFFFFILLLIVLGTLDVNHIARQVVKEYSFNTVIVYLLDHSKFSKMFKIQCQLDCSI